MGFEEKESAGGVCEVCKRIGAAAAALLCLYLQI